MTDTTRDALGELTFSPGAEEWVEYGPPEDRRRVGFHDYAGLYGVPGLYERVFYDELGMCSTTEVVRLWASVLAETDRDPATERVLELGAGNGAGGTELRNAGVGRIVGLDLEPTAAAAAERDRPGVYDRYLTGDLGAFGDDELEDLRAERPTSLVALAAIGEGHVPPAVLRRALSLVAPGGTWAFAVTPALMPGSTDRAGIATGHPELLEGLLAEESELGRVEYVHRRQTDGTPHHAVALVGRIPV